MNSYKTNDLLSVFGKSFKVILFYSEIRFEVAIWATLFFFNSVIQVLEATTKGDEDMAHTEVLVL